MMTMMMMMMMNIMMMIMMMMMLGRRHDLRGRRLRLHELRHDGRHDVCRSEGRREGLLPRRQRRSSGGGWPCPGRSHVSGRSGQLGLRLCSGWLAGDLCRGVPLRPVAPPEHAGPLHLSSLHWLPVPHHSATGIDNAMYRGQHYWRNFCENIKNNIFYILYWGWLLDIISKYGFEYHPQVNIWFFTLLNQKVKRRFFNAKIDRKSYS